MEFRFYRNGVNTETIKIAEAQNGKIVPLPKNNDRFTALLRDFSAWRGQSIKSAEKLAEMMAYKAALMRDVFYNAVTGKEESSLTQQFEAFKEVLMHDMNAAQFADVYAQTVAYGLFTARMHDKTLNDFSRGEALTLIPKTNPFLQKLFQYIAGADLDSRVVWIVDALCDVYRSADLSAILNHFGERSRRNDPVLHFYETFLAKYDAGLRKDRGVWYTPEPVVGFIVRAIDDVLKEQFLLKEGLADVSMAEITVDGHAKGKTIKVKERVHKVQLLDVATGTGTFLSEAIQQIKAKFKGQEGVWHEYVEHNLLPRLHGFELLMASYAMCHMKLDLLLRGTGFNSEKSSKRLSVYLTNSLEEHHKDSHLPFANWLSNEANEASRIKRDMPIMIAFGNPPYNGTSSNKGSWIMSLMEAYKKEPGGKVKLKERNAKWINNDYVKFIRLGEHYIERNGEGVLAYITDNSYLDNPTFRGMRWHLLSTFDDIYILDLHGNSNKKESSPESEADKNVFDIQQGVAIIIATKKINKEKKKLANLWHKDLWGSRKDKFEALEVGSLKSMGFVRVDYTAPEYFFIPRNTGFVSEYKQGFSVKALFPLNSLGIVTARDSLTIHQTREGIVNTIQHFNSLDIETARVQFALGKDARDWRVEWAQKDLKSTGLNQAYIKTILYRPFDTRWTYYTGLTKGFHCMPRAEVMKHLIHERNLALIVPKQAHEDGGGFVTNTLAGHKTFSAYNANSIFPLYIYEIIGSLEERRPNLDPKIYANIKKIVSGVTPESLFDYIYAILNSRTYRRQYAEFLKSDFPYIPYPKSTEIFNALAKLGGDIRAQHLMEAEILDKLVTSYPVGGDHKVIKINWEDTDKKRGLGKVWINSIQYFDTVPKIAWELFIGGYQPAQRWLKDRQGRSLTPDDIRYWQKVIVALQETDKLMHEVDKIPFLSSDKK